MRFNEGTQTALVAWANTFPLPRKAESLDDFYDGVLFSTILSTIDSSWDPSEIDTEDDRWLTHKKNLQSIYKGLVRLVNRDCPRLSPEAKISDLRVIASDPDEQGMCKILSLMLGVAMLGSDYMRFVPQLKVALDDSSILAPLRKILLDFETTMVNSDQSEAPDNADELATEARDPDLALEEVNAMLHAKLERTEKRLADAVTRLDTLKVSYDGLKDQSTRQGVELAAIRSTQDASSEQVIKSLEARIQERDELITQHEVKAEDDRETMTKLKAEVTAFRIKADKAEKLKDEVSELRYKVEELNRKSNVNEKIKSKLEKQATMQKEMDNLLYEREQMQQDLIDYEQVLKKNRVLEDTNAQYGKRMEEYEIEIVERDTQRKTSQEEIDQLKELLQRLEARSSADERVIAELQEQVNTGITYQPSIGTPDAEMTSFNLEEELENAKDVAPNLTLEVSRLKAENNLLRNSMGSGSENTRLRRELDDERAQRKRLQQEYNSVFEKQKMAEADVQSLLQDLPGNSNEVTSHYKVQFEKSQNELKEEQAAIRTLKERLADQDRELLAVKTDLSAIEKDSVEALEELKSTDKLISKSLQDDLEALRLEHKNATNDSDESQKALVKALLEKDALRKELDTVKEQGTGQTADSAKNNEKIKQLRTRLLERNEQLEKAERDRHDLMRKVKGLQDGSTASAQKAQTDQIIKNLQRENALIATAWYDLNSRVQSNHVVLQRRNDVPKSWLNKQRQMVNATPRK